jgi:signal transduction histidine kinase/DNA-binding response OmpR family regulator
MATPGSAKPPMLRESTGGTMSDPSVNDSAHDMLGDLRKELLRMLPLPTAFLTYYGLLLTDSLFGVPDLYVAGIALWTIVTSLLAQCLQARWPRLAAQVYLMGLAISGAALVGLSFSPLAAALFSIAILLAMALLGVRPMAAVTGVGMAAVLIGAWQHGQLGRPVLAPISVLCFTAIVSWLSHRNLTTAIEWAWSSYQQSRAATEEARQRRGELARTLKALDEAYYRLERFSAQLAQARESAEEARRAKQQFVTTVSHELRTPLNIIIGFAELITLSPESYGVRGVPRQFMGDVNRIYRGAQHLKSLIDDVLDLSQIDARHMVLLTEQASLSGVVAEAADMIWGIAAQKGLELAVDLPESLPPISLDRLRIRQVLLNLLSNAVRFTDQGRIAISAKVAAGEVQVTVADTGPGIASEDLGRLFEEFRQLDSSLSRRYEGTGLGLALSRRFVELHGGRMWAESEVGRGSRFHFTLPLVAAAPERAEARSRALLMPPGVQAQAGRTLLVVTGEAMLASLLRRHLEGYAVQAVPEQELAGAIDTYLPHAVIVNGLLPAQAGEGPAPSSLSLDALPVPVITCPLPDPAFLSWRLGVDHYVAKPVTRERLLELVAGYGQAVRRVLIVDDDAQLAELIARTVRAAPMPYEVDVACGGEEGWVLMQERRPDLVLLDLVMQGLDGLRVLQLMRADARLRSVPVIVVTARDLPASDARLPGRGRIAVEVAESLTVTHVLSCLQALLDALPPPRTAPSPPPRPGATRLAPPAS